MTCARSCWPLVSLLVAASDTTGPWLGAVGHLFTDASNGPDEGRGERFLVDLTATSGTTMVGRARMRSDPACAHWVSALVVPRVRAAGLEPRAADSLELCRRMAVDLLGRIPTVEELDRCRTQSPEQMADTFQAMPEHERAHRRIWAERLDYSADFVNPEYLREIDGLVGEGVRDEVRYDEMAGRLIVHPGFFGRYPEDDWARNVYRVFLGRLPRPDEIAALRPLALGFVARSFCNGARWERFHRLLLEEPEELSRPEDPPGVDLSDDEIERRAILVANEECEGTELAFDPCSCQSESGYAGCRSDALLPGVVIDLGSDCSRYSEEHEDGAYVRVSGFAPGMRSTTCADGDVREECADRMLDPDTFAIPGPLAPLPAASPEQMARLYGIGEALAQRLDFWEAAVDAELHRLLGWWHSGFRLPDSELADVRLMLALDLQRHGSLRELERLIVTSLLYTQPADAPDQLLEELARAEESRDDAAIVEAQRALEAMHPWLAGPTKLLAAESWLDSLGVAVGETLGICDFRYVSLSGLDRYNVDPADLESRESTLPAFYGSDYGDPSRYEQVSFDLGGCASESPRPTRSSIGLTFAQGAAARTLCANGRAVLPDGFDARGGAAELDRAAAHLSLRMLSRDSTPDETATLRGEMEACLAAGASRGGGCGSAESAVRWLCTRLAESAELTLY